LRRRNEALANARASAWAATGVRQFSDLAHEVWCGIGDAEWSRALLERECIRHFAMPRVCIDASAADDFPGPCGACRLRESNG